MLLTGISRYSLWGKTYGNGHHFVAVVKESWVYYDGLREYHCTDTGN